MSRNTAPTTTSSSSGGPAASVSSSSRPRRPSERVRYMNEAEQAHLAAANAPRVRNQDSGPARAAASANRAVTGGAFSSREVSSGATRPVLTARQSRVPLPTSAPTPFRPDAQRIVQRVHSAQQHTRVTPSHLVSLSSPAALLDNPYDIGMEAYHIGGNGSTHDYAGGNFNLASSSLGVNNGSFYPDDHSYLGNGGFTASAGLDTNDGNSGEPGVVDYSLALPYSATSYGPDGLSVDNSFTPANPNMHSNPANVPHVNNIVPTETQRTGQKRIRENDEDSPNIPAATRVRQHDGRACAGDFDEYTQEILGTAVTLYRCKATKYGAFPDPLQQAAWSKEQWSQSCGINELQVKSTPEALRIITRRGSQLRGELKTKATPIVTASLGFSSGRNKKTVAENRALAEALKNQSAYAFKIREPELKGIYEAELIQKVSNAMWFSNRLDEGVRYSEYFDPFTKEALALVLSVIENCIDEWSTGSPCAVPFTEEAYKPVYQKHLASLVEFEKVTAQYDLMGKILRNLHDEGRFHSGAEPIAAISPGIDSNHFLNALLEAQRAAGEEGLETSEGSGIYGAQPQDSSFSGASSSSAFRESFVPSTHA